MAKGADDPVAFFDADHLAGRAFDGVEPGRFADDFALDVVAGFPVAARDSLHVEGLRFEVRDPGKRPQ